MPSKNNKRKLDSPNGTQTTWGPTWTNHAGIDGPVTGGGKAAKGDGMAVGTVTPMLFIISAIMRVLNIISTNIISTIVLFIISTLSGVGVCDIIQMYLPVFACNLVAYLVAIAGANGARKLWRSIVNASGLVSSSKIVFVLILTMLPCCDAVRVHGSGEAGPGDAC